MSKALDPAAQPHELVRGPALSARQTSASATAASAASGVLRLSSKAQLPFPGTHQAPARCGRARPRPRRPPGRGTAAVRGAGPPARTAARRWARPRLGAPPRMSAEPPRSPPASYRGLGQVSRAGWIQAQRSWLLLGRLRRRKEMDRCPPNGSPARNASEEYPSCCVPPATPEGAFSGKACCFGSSISHSFDATRTPARQCLDLVNNI